MYCFIIIFKFFVVLDLDLMDFNLANMASLALHNWLQEAATGGGNP